MNWILLWQQSEPTYLYDIYFAKIAWCISQKVNEVNPILNCERNKPTDLYDLFFAKIAWYLRFKWNEMNSNCFFESASSQPSPITCFLRKLQSGGETNVNEVNIIFFQRQRAHMPRWSVFFSYRKMDDVWELNVNEVDTICFATAVCLYCPMTYFCIIF